MRAHGLDGPDNVWKTLRDLKCIFISHIHADHHIGLTQILAKRQEVRIYKYYSSTFVC